MLQYFQIFINLCLFRGKAQDIPRSEALLLVTAIAAILSSAINAIPNAGILRGTVMSVGQVLLFAGLISLMLRFRGKSERSMQTLTAMFGATTLLQLLALPFFGWHEGLLPNESEPLIALTTPLLIAAGIAVWSLTVMTSILRQAMDSGIGAALLIIIGCQSLIMVAVTTLMGSSPG
jgi:hypothetical protein